MFRTRTFALLRKTTPVLGALSAAAVVATTPLPAIAQDNTEARLRKAEAEIRALQRTVFPGGDGRFFEPSISTGNNPTRTTPNTTARTGVPAATSTSALTDVLARLDAMELELQRLTAKTEENTNALSALDTRIAALETGGASRSVPSVDAPIGGATQSNLDATTGSGDDTQTGGSQSTASTEPSSPSTTAATGPSAERVAGVQAITKPQTDDAGDDEYSYGFRLWNAGYFPEARQQLASFVEDYPSHPRITYGRNLLGRAFLDDGLPEEAARWFLRNYQADRTARRAPDSLLYLAESMIAMDDTRRACIALAEFGETYPAIATGRLADQYQSSIQKVSCDN